jgi:hypothetical protein
VDEANKEFNNEVITVMAVILITVMAVILIFSFLCYDVARYVYWILQSKWFRFPMLR